MFKLIEIIKKNLRLLIRSKSSALIVLFGPLLLILLISMAFNTSSLYDIKIGTYSDSYSELSNSIINNLNKNEFHIVKIDSHEGCVNSIKSNDVHVCAVFPADLDIGSDEKIEFYVDESRMNLVYIIINSISTKVSTKSTELSTALTSTLINSINNADSQINEASGVISKLSVNLNEIKSSIESVRKSLDGIGNGTNISSLRNRSYELNLTGDAGELINDYQSLIDSVFSETESSNSSLNSASENLDVQIENAEDINSTFSNIKNNFNSIEIKEVSRIVSPISTEIKPISDDSTHFEYTFPILLVIVMLFSGLLVSSTSIMEEKESKAFFRNFITPTPNYLFIVGSYLSNMIIVFSQILIIFLALYFVSGVSISQEVVVNLLIVILLTSSVFILLGMLIGHLFKSNETSNLAVISLSCILLFFSNTILPLETLPVAIKEIADYNPFIIGVDSLKEILLFNAPLRDIAMQFYILLGYIAVIIALIFVVRSFSKRRYVEGN